MTWTERTRYQAIAKALGLSKLCGIYEIMNKANNKRYGAVLAHWSEATEEQKLLFIAHSPALKRILDWSEQWRHEQV